MEIMNAILMAILPGLVIMIDGKNNNSEDLKGSNREVKNEHQNTMDIFSYFESGHSNPCSPCKCSSDLRVVECTNRKLSGIPSNVPSTVQNLTMSKNRIYSLEKNAFQFTTEIRALFLDENRIRSIEKGTFAILHYLVRLDLSSNPLRLSVLQTAVFCDLPSTSIDKLTLRYIEVPLVLNYTNLGCIRKTNITFLDLSENTATCQVGPYTFSKMSHLETISMNFGKCLNVNIMAFANAPHLTELTLHDNYITEFPKFVRPGTKISIIPTLQSLDLDGNFISTIKWTNFEGIGNLKVLKLSNNVIKTLRPSTFSDLRRLESLHLDRNRIANIAPTTFRSSSLRQLYLGNNPMTFRNTDIFRFSPSLADIRLEKSYLSYEVLGQLFHDLSSLRYLSVQSMRGTNYIHPRTFKGLFNLTDLLFSNNGIKEVDRSLFTDLTSLKRLDFSINELPKINETSFPHHLLHTLEEINLNGNPFECTCDMLWFLDWINTTNVKIGSWGMPSKRYRCAFPINIRNRPLSSLHLTAKRCLTQPLGIGLQVSILGTICVLVIIFITSGLHRFKWKIAYRLFQIRHKMMTNRTNSRQGKTYNFDAFVSYNGADTHWVKNVLLAKLESKTDPYFRLCLFERDWLVGHDVVECIEESIEQSYKTLLIVTNAYAKSEWCQLELTMAQHQLFASDNDNVILAIMEDIEPLNMTPRLALEMKRRPYLQWTEDPDGQKLFWDKMTFLLRETNPSVFNAMPPVELFSEPTINGGQ